MYTKELYNREDARRMARTLLSRADNHNNPTFAQARVDRVTSKGVVLRIGTY